MGKNEKIDIKKTIALQWIISLFINEQYQSWYLAKKIIYISFESHFKITVTLCNRAL